MQIINDVKLDFDDVIIRPKRSNAPSRKNIELSRNYVFKHSKSHWKGIPIVAANMVATGTFAMANELAKKEMMTCLHKHYSLDRLTQFFGSDLRQTQAHPSLFCFYTLGIKEHDIEKLASLNDSISLKGIPYLEYICVDAANGYTQYFVSFVRKLREKYPQSIIMAGNVATPEMVQELILEGADIVKVGIGGGSVCTTRLVTGVGYPQLSAIIECADAAHGLEGHICADGGCKEPGDVVKAFGAGADFVMLGGMLSGHEECEGEWVMGSRIKWNPSPGVAGAVTEVSAKKALKFYGMSSADAMDKHGDGLQDYRASEGKCVEVPYRGPVENTIQRITGGLRSACAYVGAERLKDFSKCCTFVRVNRTHNTVFCDASVDD